VILIKYQFFAASTFQPTDLLCRSPRNVDILRRGPISRSIQNSCVICNPVHLIQQAWSDVVDGLIRPGFASGTHWAGRRRRGPWHRCRYPWSEGLITEFNRNQIINRFFAMGPFRWSWRWKTKMSCQGLAVKVMLRLFRISRDVGLDCQSPTMSPACLCLV